jgi:hypothetical protein
MISVFSPGFEICLLSWKRGFLQACRRARDESNKRKMLVLYDLE